MTNAASAMDLMYSSTPAQVQACLAAAPATLYVFFAGKDAMLGEVEFVADAA